MSSGIAYCSKYPLFVQKVNFRENFINDFWQKILEFLIAES